jgi:hypothetical protein
VNVKQGYVYMDGSRSISKSFYYCDYNHLLCLGRFFNVLILYTVGRTSWTGDQPDTTLLYTKQPGENEPKRRFMLRVELEPMNIALDRTTTAATFTYLLSRLTNLEPFAYGSESLELHTVYV